MDQPIPLVYLSVLVEMAIVLSIVKCEVPHILEARLSLKINKRGSETGHGAKGNLSWPSKS